MKILSKKNIAKFLHPLTYYNYLKRNIKIIITKASYKNIECDVRDLFLLLKKDNQFYRYDIIVRYLAVENFYNKNDFGFDLYKKMQSKRVSFLHSEARTKRYKELIESYDKKGHKSSSKILLWDNLHLYDGSHRIALALYHKAYKIKCKVRPDTWVCNFYGLEWFEKTGFSYEEINKIQEKYNEIFNEIKRY